MATETISVTQQGTSPERSPRRVPSRRVLAGGLLVVLLAMVAGTWAVQAQDQARRVPKGVEVAGVPVAGLTVPEAQAALEARFASLADAPIRLQGAGKEWTFPAHAVGVALDAAATAKAAHAAGRDVQSGAAVPLVLSQNRAGAEATLAKIATDVAVAPQNASFTVDGEGIRVVPAQVGRRLDAEGTWAAIVAAAQQYPFGAATIQLADVPPAVSDADIAPALAVVHRLSDQPVDLAAAGPDGASRTWTLDPATLRGWLQMGTDAKGAPTVQQSLDDAKVSAYLQSLAATLKRNPKDAVLSLPNYATAASLAPEAPGQQLNTGASLPHVQAAAQGTGSARATALVLDSIPATTTAAMLAPLKDQLDATMRDGVSLTYGDKAYKLRGAVAALALYVQAAPKGAALPYQITVNDDDLGRLVSRVAYNVDLAPQNVLYRMTGGAIALVRPPRDGLSVDRPKAAAVIKDALLTGKKQAELPTTVVKPEFAATDQAGLIQTPTLLQSDHTFYGSSSPERNWNVTLGASKLDGWLIAPGATFSVNEALGDLTLAAGFKMGWAILVQGGDATTIPAEAGGICQVVTTLFHPVFWAGLPFVERHHHSYWISLYGQPPLGKTGLDATISPPDSDLRFKNTTGNWLMIRANGDHQNISVQLWGTNPGWRVDVSQPVITNIVKTDHTPRYQTSDKVQAGREVMVEHAQDGFTSDIHRQVYDASGAKIDDWHAQGTYLPSHDTYVRGTAR